MAAEYRYDPRTDVPLAPGETIREILEDRGITQVDFAVRLDKSEKFVSQLINGRVALTYQTAVELERVLGVPSSFWNNAESRYRDQLAHQQRQAGLAEQSQWAESFPLKAMESNGWIARETTPAEQAEELLSFFGTSSIGAYRAYWGSPKRLAARISTASTAETPALVAWLRAGERAAEKARAEPFSESTFRRVLTDLREVSRLTPAEGVPLAVKRCATAGVVVAFMPEMGKNRYPAISWWPSRARAVIQLGMRYATDDQLWFALYRQAGHLLLDDRRGSGISALDDDPVAEDRATHFATDMLILCSDYQTFAAAGRPTKASVREFAERHGISASIVVGRLQRDGFIPNNWMNDLKTPLQWAELAERPTAVGDRAPKDSLG
ncbi:MAG: helix-turn-helix domain-containing protein [Coriobacteriia bacterium]